MAAGKTALTNGENMKISNAPGRKMARQIAAKEGGSQRFYATDARVIQARTIKTKKRL